MADTKEMGSTNYLAKFQNCFNEFTEPQETTGKNNLVKPGSDKSLEEEFFIF